MGKLITWRSKKQYVVGSSSAKIELKAMAHGICEGLWLNRLLRELKIPLEKSVNMLCDNQVAISNA